MRSIYCPPDTIHIWKIVLDRDQCPDCLPHPQDLKISKRFLSEHGKLQYIQRRIWLRYILSHYIGEFAQEDFSFIKEGKPCFPFSGWSFNLSHSDTALLIAVANTISLGIDVERIRCDIEWESMADFFMDDTELQCFRKMPYHEKLISFFDIWIKKEAYGKMLGVGLSIDPRNWSIGFSKTEVACDPCCKISLFSWGNYRGALAYQADTLKRIEFIEI